MEILIFVFLTINYFNWFDSGVVFHRVWSWLFSVRIKTEMSSWNIGSTGIPGSTQLNRESSTLVSVRRPPDVSGKISDTESSGALHRNMVEYIGNGFMACTTVFSNGSFLLGLWGLWSWIGTMQKEWFSVFTQKSCPLNVYLVLYHLLQLGNQGLQLLRCGRVYVPFIFSKGDPVFDPATVMLANWCGIAAWECRCHHCGDCKGVCRIPTPLEFVSCQCQQWGRSKLWCTILRDLFTVHPIESIYKPISAQLSYPHAREILAEEEHVLAAKEPETEVSGSV